MKYTFHNLLFIFILFGCQEKKVDILADAESRSPTHQMSKAAGMAETSQLKYADQLLKPLLENNPNWGEGWIYLGRSLAAQGKYAAGAAAVEKGGNLGEKRSTVWLEACSMALKSGNQQLALTYLEKALEAKVHRKWLIQTSSFDGFLDLDDFLDTDAARQLLQEASQKRPSLHPDFIALDRKFYAQRKSLGPEQIQMMTEKYVQTVAIFPKDGELHYRLGKVQVRFGKYKDALISFQRSKDLNYLPVYNDGWLAHVNAQLGNKNAAFAHLERNLAAMDTPDWISYPGEFDPLQDDPRWKEMVDKYRPTNTPSVQIPVKDQGSVPYPTKKWSRADPANVGINENTLLETAGIIESSFPNVTSLLVVKNGQLVFERYFNGYSDQDAFNMKSVTKSFTSTAAGIMHNQGIISDLNTPIAKILPEYFKDIDDPLKHQITLKHLLTMTAGLDWVEGEEKALELFLTGNYAELILKEKQIHLPGEVYEYSSAVSHLLAVSLAKLSSQNLLSYTQKNLFDPLGITPEVWAQDLNGYNLGDGELRLRPQDLAKFGLLMLRGGKWDGKSVVSTEWVRNATAIQVPEARGPHTSYGFQFWVINVRGRRVIKAAGHGGQRCWIIPSLDMVAVITSEPLAPDNDPDAILGQWIIPSVQGGTNE